MAVEDSGIDFEKVNKERAGVIIGSGIGGMWIISSSTTKSV